MKRRKIVILMLSIPFFLGFSTINNDISTSKATVPPQIGDMAPEIEMLSLDRKTSYKLSELKGKLVLVNFWASLVAPCRFENPNIVKAYKNYKDKSFTNGKGFAIFSVSLDTDLASWKNAITKDKLSWKHHVSDLKGYDSKAAKDYGVKKIPYNFLIDGEGKIVAVNIKRADLSKTLNSYLK